MLPSFRKVTFIFSPLTTVIEEGLKLYLAPETVNYLTRGEIIPY